MNLPAADSIGLTSILDVLAPPATAVFDDAPSERSFDAVLNEPKSGPPASAAEKPASSEERRDHEEDESDATTAVVIVPAVVLDASPAAMQVDETAQVEAEQTSEPADKVPQSLAASMQPNQSIDVAAVVLPARDGEPEAVDGEAATIVVVPSPLDKQAVTSGTDAINVEQVELEASPETDSAESRPVIAAMSRTSSDKGHESGRDSDQSFKQQSAVHGELAFAVEPVATGTAEPKGIETPAAVAPLVETVQPATTPSSATPHQQPPASRLLPDLLSAATGRATRDADAPQVDSARLLNRVARAFVAAQDGSGEVRLRLSPPELGALRLEVKVLDGTLIARLETETTAARTALIENLPALRERLAEQGIRIERFDVELRQHHSLGAFDRPANQQPQDQPPQSHFTERQRRLPQVAEGVVARATVIDLDQRRLNVIV
jgi:flagellar hook-length control protein FliK